ncbi:MAG TPA: hypothetical protein VFX02_04590 [Gammaproteobacteria bacterium]|nr:hypothetical protein [Gammaproteobacteria bacterium]
MQDCLQLQPDHRCTIRGLIPLLLCMVSTLAPQNVYAQSDSGWLAKPSLMAALAEDDNIFFSSTNPEDDSVLRVSPAIEAGYRSAPTAFNAYYTLDALHYDRFSELDDNTARQHGELNFSHEATTRLSLLADSSYTETEAPGEIDPISGLELGRVRAEHFYFSPGAVYQFDRVTTGSVSYSLNREDVAGGVGSDTQVLALHADHLVSRRDTLSFGYQAESFDFEDGGSVDMHVLLVGGTRRFTPQTSVSLLAGPRFWEDGDEDEIDPEVAAGFLHEFSRGDFGVTYARSQTAVIGIEGAATTQNLNVELVYPIGKDLGLRFETGFITSELRGLEADSVVTDAELAWRLDDYLTLVGSYEFNSQRGSLETPDFGEIDRRVVWIGLVIAPPVRTDSAWWRRERANSTVLEEPTLRRRELRLESE